MNNTKDIIAAIPSSIQFYGVWKNDGTWNDFLIGKQIFRFDPLFGYEPNPAHAIIHHRSAEQQYLYIADKDGFVPNTLQDASALERIKIAKEKNKKVLVLLGGSTVFGTGSRTPEENISAHLQNIFNTNHNNIEVINAGVGGYSSDNQFRYFLYKVLPLKPDMIVFYDGWNDAGYLNAMLSIYGNNYRWGYTRQSYSLIERDGILLSLGKMAKYTIKHGLRLFFESFIKVPVVGKGMLNMFRKIFPWVFSNPVSYVSGVYSQKQVFNPQGADIYQRNIQLTADLCKLNNISFTHFFQPLLITGSKRRTAKEEMYFKGVKQDETNVYNQFYDYYEQQHINNGGFKNISLRKIFDQVLEEVYVDSGHLNSLGNKIVAENIYKNIV